MCDDIWTIVAGHMHQHPRLLPLALTSRSMYDIVYKYLRTFVDVPFVSVSRLLGLYHKPSLSQDSSLHETLWVLRHAHNKYGCGWLPLRELNNWGADWIPSLSVALRGQCNYMFPWWQCVGDASLIQLLVDSGMPKTRENMFGVVFALRDGSSPELFTAD